MKTYGKYAVLKLLAGLATALIIMFSQLFYFQAATYCQKTAETEQQEQKSAGKPAEKKAASETYISVPSFTISPVFNAHISDGIAVVLETLLAPQEEEAKPVIPMVANGLLQTLFRFIIAPNAP